jgi:predicted transcriptional regulator
MTTVEDIEKAVEQLSPDKLAKFRAWFERFEAERFDDKIEQDAVAGKLDKLADAGLRQYHATHAELDGVNRGLRDAAEGKFVSPEQVEAVFAKHRR